MARSLVVQTAFLGDVILTTPLITALAAHGPVDVVTTRVAATLLEGHPDVRQVIAYDKRGGDRGAVGMLRLARDVRAEGPGDAAYLGQGSLRSAVVVRLAGYRRRVGLDSSAGRLLFTEVVRDDRTRHKVQRLLSLAVASPPVVRPRLYPGDRDESAVDRLLREAGHAGEPLLGVAPGSAWATKRWPYHAGLIDALAGLGRVVLVGGPEDRALATGLADGARTRPIDATGRLTLLGSAALVGRCVVLVSNDSAPQHMASAMDTPTVTVFGPTAASQGFGPLAARSAVAGLDDLPCRPCHAHGPPACPLGHFRCMRDLGADRVERLVRAVVAAAGA